MPEKRENPDNRAFGGIKPGVFLGVLIIITWLITMAVLVRDHRMADTPIMDESGDFFASVNTAAKWRDIEEWMLLVQANPQNRTATSIGASRTVIRQLDDPTSSAVYSAEFAIQGKISPLLPQGSVKGRALLSSNGALTSFSVIGNLGQLQIATQGEIHDSILYVKLNKPNGIDYFTKILSQPVSFSELLRPTLSRHMEIKPGERLSSPVVDPLSGKSRGQIHVRIQEKETLNLNGMEFEAYRVVTSIGDVSTVMWINDDGQTIRRNLVNHLRMDRTDRETALKIAPELEEPINTDPLDLADFRNAIPLDDAATDTGPSTGLLGLILQ